MNVEEVKALATAEATKVANELRQKYEATITSLQTQLQNERIARAELEDKYKSLRNSMVQGKGNVAGTAIKPEDLQEFKVARIQGASLSEIVEAEAASKGLSVDEYIKASLKGQIE